MTRFSGRNRRESTIIRDNQVIDVYREVMDELGVELSRAVSKQYIYNKVRERTGLCTKTIAFIINYVTKDKRGL